MTDEKTWKRNYVQQLIWVEKWHRKALNKLIKDKKYKSKAHYFRSLLDADLKTQKPGPKKDKSKLGK